MPPTVDFGPANLASWNEVPFSPFNTTYGPQFAKRNPHPFEDQNYGPPENVIPNQFYPWQNHQDPQPYRQQLPPYSTSGVVIGGSSHSPGIDIRGKMLPPHSEDTSQPEQYGSPDQPDPYVYPQYRQHEPRAGGAFAA
jgi:hypothetical protein